MRPIACVLRPRTSFRATKKAAACGVRPDALVCLGYPLRSPRGTLRDAVLRRLKTPVLFVQGTRDALCPLELLDGVRRQMRTRSELWVVEGGDHSLTVGKRALAAQDRTQADVDARIVKAIASFPPLRRLLQSLQTPQPRCAQ